MKIVLVREPEKDETYLQDAFNCLKRAHRGKTELNLASALAAVAPITSTNTPEEAGSILEHLAEQGIIDIKYGA